jgi:hypothetical protein
LIVTGSVRRTLMAVEAAEHNVIQGLDRCLIETEPSLTDRLLGGLEDAFAAGNKGLRADKFNLRLRTLRDRGANAPEGEFGADLCVSSIPTSRVVRWERAWSFRRRWLAVVELPFHRVTSVSLRFVLQYRNETQPHRTACLPSVNRCNRQHRTALSLSIPATESLSYPQSLLSLLKLVGIR